MNKNNFIEKLTQQLKKNPVNKNLFYIRFKEEFLSKEQLRRFTKQYFWFCKNFITVLVGLIYNTPAKEQDVRLELIKTLYSEMGYGKKEAVHLNLLRKFTTALQISEKELEETKPIAEIEQYLTALTKLFVNSDFRKAIGAEFGVEITAFPEFTYLYPGVKKYIQFTEQDIIFFKFHLAEEELHGKWLTEAVQRLAITKEDQELISQGALKAADEWNNFWNGMYRYVFSETNRN